VKAVSSELSEVIEHVEEAEEPGSLSDNDRLLMFKSMMEGALMGVYLNLPG
jgi:hypothetical protein